MSIKTRMQELTALRGISGREDAVRAYILDTIQGHCQSYAVDALGSVIVRLKGKQRGGAAPLVFAAHMDEVGFMVTAIDKDGTLHFTNVGGIMPAVASARAVVVGLKGIPGVIGAKPIHMLTAEEKEKYTPLEDMRIDIGASTKEEAEALVSVGEPVTFWSEYREMGGDNFCVKAIDDRGGCAMLLELICGEPLAHDCIVAFTVQEENGSIGARPAAFATAPGIAIVVEGTTAGDTPAVTGAKRVCELGHGPVISHRDGGAIYDYELYRRAGKLAEANNIPWQTKMIVAGGNDSGSFQRTAGGCRIMAVSMPVRYLHSATSVANWQDIENTVKLLRLMAEEFGG
ncbi:MAG: M42 family peptidase [Angelakisella sp.]